MTNLLLDRSLRVLAHPLTVTAAGVLAVNALVLQPLVPSWWTGKIGGMAWLLVAPWLVLAVWAAILPERFRARGPWAEGVLGLVAASYALVKAVPGVNAWVVTTIEGFGFRPKLALDVSDLLALPVVVLAYGLWRATADAPARHAPVARPPRGRRLALALAVVAVMADSPGPQDFGPRCLIARDGMVRAYSLTSQIGYFQTGGSMVWRSVYVSTDGGQSWTEEAVEAEAPQVDEPCPQVTWPADMGDEQGALYYVQGQGVYASIDGGVTLTLEQRLDTAYSSLLDPDSGSLIIAAGEDGLFVRTPDGEWTQPVE